MKRVITLVFVAISVSAGAQTYTGFFNSNYGGGMGTDGYFNLYPLAGYGASSTWNVFNPSGNQLLSVYFAASQPVVAIGNNVTTNLTVSGQMNVAGTVKSTALSIGATQYDYLGSADLGAIEFPRAEILYATTHAQNQLYLSANAYYSGGFKYRNAAPAAGIGIDGGTLFLWSAGSGSANAAVPMSSNLTITNSGYVGIGSNSPDQKLTVNGNIHAKEVKVDLSVPGPDYVFEQSYELPTLDQVRSYIDENKHLPEIPSAKEMEANGIKVGEMNMLLLKKVEELTLYVLDLQKQVRKLEEDSKK